MCRPCMHRLHIPWTATPGSATRGSGIGSSLNKNTETVGSCCTTVGWEDPPIYNKYPRCYHRERSRKQPESRPTQLVFSISGHEKSTPGCGSPDGSASDNELPKSVLELHTITFLRCLPLRGHLHILGLTASSLAVVPLGDCSNSCHQAFMISHSESFTPMWRRLGQLFLTV